jgi:hypothetical protein
MVGIPFAHSAKMESISSRIESLEIKKPQQKQLNRSEILRALIAAYGGKMLSEDARKKMGISEQLFSMLVFHEPKQSKKSSLQSIHPLSEMSTFLHSFIYQSSP